MVISACVCVSEGGGGMLGVRFCCFISLKNIFYQLIGTGLPAVEAIIFGSYIQHASLWAAYPILNIDACAL